MRHKAFISKEKNPTRGFNIATTLRKKPVKGVVGLEIEVEGVKLPKAQDKLAPYWSFHVDHSLRGDDNAEYVLTKPVDFSDVEPALKHLWGLFSSYESRLDESNRTSVHVHLNAQKFHLNRLTSFMALYFCVEELLTAWCGEHRVGNLFCLRAKDAPAIISHIKKFIRSDGQAELPDRLHYAGLNANALCKFGSIEIRTLRGVSNPEVILDWVGLLERLYTLSEEMPDPRKVCEMFSYEGPMSFFEQVFGPKTQVVRSGIDYSEEQIRDALYDGIRLAQDLCYCRDWDLYVPVETKDDPFGRLPKKIPVLVSESALLQHYQNFLNQHLDSNAAVAPPGPAEQTILQPAWVGQTEPFTVVEEPDEEDYDDEEEYVGEEYPEPEEEEEPNF